MTPGVSVIICCYNSVARLSATLTHLFNQKVTPYINWEVIIVDNCSTDGTYDFALKLLNNGTLSFKVVQQLKPGLANARLKGFETSKFEYLLYCDDDNWLSDNYIETVFEIMEANPSIGILGGMGEAVFENEEPVWFKTYSRDFAVGDQSSSSNVLSQVEKVYGAGSTMRRSFLQCIYSSGFKSILLGRNGNQITSGEDTELCFMAGYLGYEVWYSRHLLFKHLMTAGRMNWNYMKKLYDGFGRANIYLQAYKHIEKTQKVPAQNLRLPLWLDTFIHKIKYLSMFYPAAIKKINTEGNADALKFIAMKAEAMEIWKQKGNYSKLFDKVYANQNLGKK